jgi:hypothetical protein
MFGIRLNVSHIPKNSTLLHLLHSAANMTPPSTASGSMKRERPSDNTPGSSSKSKRHDHHKYSDIAFPISDDDAEEGDADAMDNARYSEAQEALPQRPAFDKALEVLEKKIALSTQKLQNTLGKHCSVSEDLRNIKSKADDAAVPLRICTDPNLERTISDYAGRFPNTFAIVVTKIDEGITDELAAEMTAKGHSIGDYEEAKANILDLKEVLVKTKHTLKHAALTPEARHSWRDQEDKVKQEIHDEESKIFECLVDARNDYIGDRLRTDKKKHLPTDAQLPIHFVSNKQYDMHKQIIEPEGPSPEIASTGIPGLRAYALCLAAPGAWTAQQDQLMFKIRVLFRGVNMWAQGSVAVQDHEGLMDCVNTVFNVWQVRMNESIEQTTSELGTGIIQSLRTAHVASLQGAMRWYETITTPRWWSRTFWAFYKKNGKHRTSVVVVEESWNERFIEI